MDAIEEQMGDDGTPFPSDKIIPVLMKEFEACAAKENDAEARDHTSNLLTCFNILYWDRKQFSPRLLPICLRLAVEVIALSLTLLSQHS